MSKFNFFLKIIINNYKTISMIFKMQDGRAFTDFTPSCALNNNLQNKYKTSNSHDYRYYLQRNADSIHEEFAKNALQDQSAGHCEKCPVCEQALAWKPTGQVSASNA